MPPFLREPFEVYRSKRQQYTTSHQLIDYRRCPLLYRKKQSGLVPEVVGDRAPAPSPLAQVSSPRPMSAASPCDRRQ